MLHAFWKRYGFALVGVATLLALAQSVFAPDETSAAPRAAPGEVVAVLENDGVGDDQRLIEFIRLAQDRGFTVRFRYDLAGLGLELITLNLAPKVTALQAIDILEAAAPYSIVGVNHVYHLAESRGAPPAPRLFARKAIGWPAGLCAVNAKIGVIDTAVRARDVGSTGSDLVTESFLRAGERPSREDHGASIARILAGPGGLLSEASLFVAAAMTEDDSGRPLARVDHLARSINWMAENEVTIVNLSLAGPRNKIFSKVVQSAAARGLILVAAVCNAGPSSPPLFPAAFKDVIAVTAVDAARRVFPKAVRGGHVDLAAPGVDIWLRGAAEQRYASGTSLAAPYVAARLAVAAAKGRVTDVQSARRLLADEAQDLGPAGRDPVFGEGLLRGPAACS